MTRQLRNASKLGITMLMALAAGGPLAMADVPAALDRVPADAGVVVAIPNIQKLQDAMKVIQDTFQLPDEEANMGVGKDVMNAAGVKKDGSMAIAVIFPEAEDADEAGDADKGDGKDKEEGADADGDDDQENAGDDEGGMVEEGAPITFVVVPVTDYKAFVTGLKGDPSAAIAELQTENQELYAKDIGGGYAALSEDSGALGTFSGKAGSLAAYKALMGKTGVSLADSSDLVVVANIQVLAPKIKQGMAEMSQNLAGMGQPDVAAAGGFLKAFGEAVTTDGQAAMLGVDVEPDGLRIETAASFKEGSPTAALLQTAGKASGLLGSLPAVPQGFLFAGAMDTTAPGLKKILETYADADTRAAMAAAEAESWMGWTKKSDGMAGIIGTSPALMGGPGFFVNTMVFAKSGNPASLIELFKQSLTEANGKNQNGVSLTTSYKAGAATVAGTSADEWQVGMKTDPNSPAAQQSQMMMVTLFGPKGSPGGYVAAAKSGVVMTMSKNSPLLESALKAAGGDGPFFSSDPGVQAVAAKLPAGRIFEVYVGVKDILNMVLPFAAMFGAGPIQVDIPADLAPIGMGGTSQDGTMRISTYMPTAVLKTFSSLAHEMNQGGGDGQDQNDGADDQQQNGGGRPRF